MSNLLSDIQLGNFLYLNDHPNQYFETIKKQLDDGFKKNKDIDIYNSIKDAFFSARNIDIIQRWVIKEVYHQTKKKLLISYQNTSILIQLMNDIFVEYAQFLPFQFKEQLYELNSKVVNLITPVIIKNAIGQLNLIRDQNTYTTIPRPENVNNKGSRITPSLTTF